MKIGGRTIEVSSRDKVFFPHAELTKGDLVDYYQRVAGMMVPHTKRYGASLQRFPAGLQDEGFYTKDIPDYFPNWIKTVEIPKREGGSFTAPGAHFSRYAAQLLRRYRCGALFRTRQAGSHCGHPCGLG